MKVRALLLIGLCCALSAAGAGARTTPHRRAPHRRAPHTRQVQPVTVGTPPLTLAPANVSNGTAAAVNVRIWPALLRQRLDGSFAFSERPDDLAAAARILGLTTYRFSLAPGHTQRVGLTWRSIAPAGGAYVGLVTRGLPAAARGALPSTSDHLLGVRLLDPPGGHASARVTQIATAQGPGTSLHFTPRVENTGDRVAAPTNATLTILDARHRVVVQKAWHGDVVLPGASRDFIVPVRMQIPPGGYTAVTKMDFGSSGQVQSSTAFRLVAPNLLATQVVSLRDFTARAVSGHQAHVTAMLRSVGNTTSATTVAVTLYRLLGDNAVGPILASRVVRLHEMVPGSSRYLAFGFGPRLPHGKFRLALTYHDQPGAASTATEDFSAVEHLSVLEQTRRFIRANIAVSVLIGIILVLLAVSGSAGAIARWHRWRAARASAHLRARQRRLEAELARTAASRARKRRIAAELASGGATPRWRRRGVGEEEAIAMAIQRQQELAKQLEAAASEERRRRRQAAQLAMAYLATAKTESTARHFAKLEAGLSVEEIPAKPEATLGQADRATKRPRIRAFWPRRQLGPEAAV